MPKFFTGFLLLFILQRPLFSQVSDSIQLEEIMIRGIAIEKYAAGSKIASVDSSLLSVGNSGSLAEVLQRNTTLYIREYGNGMLSNVSFRGTSASQTAILWNGLNINSFTLGNLDLALIPVYAVDEVEVQHGSASSLYGSDAIGGTIHLSNHPDWKPRFNLAVQQDFGSFGQFFTGSGLQYSNGKLEFNTRVYQKSAENNFRFRNTAQLFAPEQRQQNASFRFRGILQEVSYRISKTQSLSFNGWLNHNFREIQPTMPANLISTNYEHLEDQNLRLVLDYRNDLRSGFLTLKSGYVNDLQLFNDQSSIRTGRFIQAVQYEKPLGNKLVAKAGIDWNHIRADVDGYQRQVIENRNDWFLSWNYTPFSPVALTLNLRQTLVGEFAAPITPSLGTLIDLYNKSNKLLQFKALFANGYRIPTLNDRYWPLSGNTDLRPETSNSWETGLSYEMKGKNSEFQTEVTFFEMYIEDMITWVPAGGALWIPQNIREVESQGFEWSGTGLLKKGRWQYRVEAGLSLLSSTEKKGTSNGDARISDRQLPYTPKSRGSLNLMVNFDKLSASLINYYVGSRFTTLDNREQLNAYFLSDLSVGQSLKILKQPVNLAFRVNNLFNIEYQNLEYRAMPGRNFQLSARVNFSDLK